MLTHFTKIISYINVDTAGCILVLVVVIFDHGRRVDLNAILSENAVETASNGVA